MPPTLRQLATRHTEHINNAERWELLSAIIDGGDRVTDKIKRLLLPNPDNRPESIIAERIKVATYTNKIGPILNRFNSQLFYQDGVYVGSKDKFWTDTFFPGGSLLDGDDDGRASFKTLLMEAMHDALAIGKAVIQVDTRISVNPPSRASQSQNGELEPYVVLLPRSALWDWDSGERGFNFVKIHKFQTIRNGWDKPPIPVHDFTIYERDGDRILASRYVVKKIAASDNENRWEPFNLDLLEDEDVQILTLLEKEEIFNYKNKFLFPVITITLPKSLCIGSQLFEPQKSYYCQTAGLEFALYSNNCSMPVISGVDDDDDDPLQNQKMGEGYYLTLKTGQSITAFERSGGTITTAIDYRAELKRDIYDTLQQIAMSASDGSAIVSRSGQSKKEDRRPEELLLERYGQFIREASKQVLDVAAIAHGEDVSWEVSGFDDFLAGDLTEDISEYQGITQASIPSPTFQKAIAKSFVKSVGQSLKLNSKDINQAIKEIDEAKPEDFQPGGGMGGGDNSGDGFSQDQQSGDSGDNSGQFDDTNAQDNQDYQDY
jgi:hypothetical protein